MTSKAYGIVRFNTVYGAIIIIELFKSARKLFFLLYLFTGH